MKGIILAGGRATRLYPITIAVSKHLLPIYDKPMIYYPLSVLMLAGIKDILIISTKESKNEYEMLLGDGSWIGLSIKYKIQEEPKGLAEAFIIGEDFIENDNVCLILGDNIFYGNGLTGMLEDVSKEREGATIFGYPVQNPSEFGIINFDKNHKVKSIVEKPKETTSKYAVPGLYFYDNKVIQIAKNIEPSARGEKEITDINNQYLKSNELKVKLMNRGMTWFDMGTPSNMLKASTFVETIQERQGIYIACIEEIAWRKKYIDDKKLKELGDKIKQTNYGKYILNLL